MPSVSNKNRSGKSKKKTKKPQNNNLKKPTKKPIVNKDSQLAETQLIVDLDTDKLVEEIDKTDLINNWNNNHNNTCTNSTSGFKSGNHSNSDSNSKVIDKQATTKLFEKYSISSDNQVPDQSVASTSSPERKEEKFIPIEDQIIEQSNRTYENLYRPLKSEYSRKLIDYTPNYTNCGSDEDNNEIKSEFSHLSDVTTKSSNPYKLTNATPKKPNYKKGGPLDLSFEENYMNDKFTIPTVTSTTGANSCFTKEENINNLGVKAQRNRSSRGGTSGNSASFGFGGGAGGLNVSNLLQRSQLSCQNHRQQANNNHNNNTNNHNNKNQPSSPLSLDNNPINNKISPLTQSFNLASLQSQKSAKQRDLEYNKNLKNSIVKKYFIDLLCRDIIFDNRNFNAIYDFLPDSYTNEEVESIKDEVRKFIETKSEREASGTDGIDYRVQVQARTAWSAEQIKNTLGEDFLKRLNQSKKDFFKERGIDNRGRKIEIDNAADNLGFAKSLKLRGFFGLKKYISLLQVTCG